MSEEVKASADATTTAETKTETGTLLTGDNKQPAEGVKTETKEASGNTEASQEQKKVVPEKYELKLPEGSVLKPEVIEKVSQFAKENGLSNEAAQAILERENAAVKSFQDAQQAEIKTMTETWAAQAQADKEIGGAGGEKFGENVEVAKNAIAKFGSEEFKKALNETGLGNHPELIRTFMKIGQAMANDKLVLAGNEGPDSKKSHAEILYGSSSQ